MNIKTEESEAQNWNKKGKALRAIGKYKKAIACYDKAIKIEPLYDRARNNKRLVLKGLDTPNEMLKRNRGLSRAVKFSH